MKSLLTITEQDIVQDAPVVDTANYRKREAARAVVIDDDGKVALLRVGADNYHKLPGGGIDEGENIQDALERELLEEIGCKAEVLNEVGAIIEYRDEVELFQTSYCFTAKQIGEKGEPDFTEHELNRQFSIVWAENIDDAIAILDDDEPASYEGFFIQKRDLVLLRAAKELL